MLINLTKGGRGKGKSGKPADIIVEPSHGDVEVVFKFKIMFTFYVVLIFEVLFIFEVIFIF